MKRIVFAVAMLICAVSFGQEFRATITGRVTDSTGAVIPKAVVVITNTDTGVKTTSATDSGGTYSVPFLLPGTYSVSASAPGFGNFVHDGIKLLSGAKVQEDLQLSVGAQTQEVRVTADAPLIEMATATSGQVMTQGEIEDLPDNGRSPLSLAKEMYGVVAKQKNSVVQARPFDNSAASDYSLGGGNSQSNEYLLNGVPNMQDSSRLPGFSPLQDAVQAVQVGLFVADASTGDTSGGTVNLVTRSGSNTFHGALSEFNQFSAINAQPWCFSVCAYPAATRQNQYGAYISGPVWIPKVFNGRNKLFFAYSFEGFKGSAPAPSTTTVPTVAERTGDFSALLAIGTTVTGTRCKVGSTNITSTYNSYQLFEPTTAIPDPSCPGQVLRSPITGNKFTHIDPIALNYLNYFPLPNEVGAADGENNFFSNVPTLNNYSSQSGRLDYSINDNNKIFFETHRSQYIKTSGNVFQNIATGSTSYTVYQGGLIDYVHTFNSSATLDARGSLTRSYLNSSLPSQGFKATSIGLPAYLNQNPSTSLTRVSFTSFPSLSTQPGNLAVFDTIQFFAAFTKVIGHHTLKIGPDFRQNKNNPYSPGYASGTIGFSNTFFGVGGGAASPLFGGDLASFLYGIPTGGTYNISYPLTYNNWYWAAFIQDDWRVSPSLTLNLGLRGETETGINESQNRAVVGFDPNAVNSATAGAKAAYSLAPFPELPAANFSATGGLIFASPSHRSEYSTPFGYFSPRVGFSYAPPVFNNKFVLRGGMGIYINPYNDYYTPQSYGFTAASTLTASNNANLTPAASFANPFPTTNPILQPTGSALGVNQNLGANITIRQAVVQAPYSERWSLDTQFQLSRDTMINIGYIGNHQVHLTTTNCVSCVPQLPFLSKMPGHDAAVQTNLSTAVPNPFKGLSNVTGTLGTAATVTKLSLLAAFPEYGSSGVSEQLVPYQSATYNAVLFRFYKRASNGLTMNLNYTYSHNLSTSQLNQGGPQIYGENASDFPNHIAITLSYHLPFGQNQKFLAHSGRVVDALVGGFTFNSIYQYLSGAALSWSTIPLFANGTQYDPTLTINPRAVNGVLNKAKFDTNANDQPSSTYNIRTFPLFYARQDPTNNLDASVLKDFHIGERFLIQYRFEAFNSLNHAAFGAPNLSPTSATFGVITSTSSAARVLQQGLRFTF
jgi:Carboxypeptidase regulatory-like domain